MREDAALHVAAKLALVVSRHRPSVVVAGAALNEPGRQVLPDTTIDPPCPLLPTPSIRIRVAWSRPAEARGAASPLRRSDLPPFIATGADVVKSAQHNLGTRARNPCFGSSVDSLGEVRMAGAASLICSRQAARVSKVPVRSGS